MVKKTVVMLNNMDMVYLLQKKNIYKNIIKYFKFGYSSYNNVSKAKASELII